ncbi:glycerophosphoryl diester phosphodiesterase [Neptuniibacter halophilus]|uniref:glycerophosphoryl diester phosphodiesterase n=1 Tax=Neptuniibacter halophilus TaxID=651666 RepID=UPI00257459C3|nr:glycerophosphoryl diester phosphodiesterase [Neptuniibacter halophilus]
MIASPVIGHRGAAQLAPENTLAGIRMAAESGVSWVELDVTLLGDGTPVLCHDEVLDRCSNRQGPLAFLSVSDLPELDMGSWFAPQWLNEPMPHLSDALLLCQELNLGLNLEIKPFGLDPEQVARRVFAETEVYWQQPERLLVSSFDETLLTLYRALTADTQMAMLFDFLPELWQLKAEALNAVSIHCDCSLISREEVQQIKTAGYDLYCYTCNNPIQAAELLQWGVDGIFTDNPLLMKDLLPSPCNA